MEIKSEQVNVGGAQRPATRIEVKITEAENFTMYLRDDVVPLDDPVTIVVNGKVVVDKKMVERNLSLFINTALPRRYFMFPYMGRIEANFKLKNEYEAKKPAPGVPGGAGGQGAGGAGGAPAAGDGGKTEDDKSTPDDKSK